MLQKLREQVLRRAVAKQYARMPRVGSIGLAIAIAIAYFLAARLSLALLTEPDGVAVFWPAAGISSGILIAFGRAARLPVAAGVMTATIAANLLGDRNIAGAIIFALCNAGEAMLIAWLIEYHCGSGFSLDSSRRVLGLFLATAVGTAISGVGGVAGFVLFHGSDAPILTTWLNWFVADAIGVVSVAPLVVGLARAWHDLPQRSELVEGTLALVVLAIVSAIGLGSPTDYWFTILPLALLFPLLLWPAVHCRPVFAAAAAFVIALAIVWTITFGIGRLGDPNIRLADRVHAAEAALLAISACALVLAALFAERRSNEAALKDSNDRLQLALDGAELGIWSIDPKTGRFENDARDRWIHGHHPETPPKTLAEARAFIHPNDLPTLDTEFAACARAGGNYSAEYRLTPDSGHGHGGQQRWIAVECTVVRDASGAPVQLLGVTRDVTHRKLAEQALPVRNAQLAIAGRIALMGSFAYDVGSGKMQVSPGYAAIHDLPEGAIETNHTDWRTRVHPDDLTRLEASLQRDIDGGRSEHYCEYRIVRPDGEIRWIEARSFISYDRGGAAQRIVGANIDVTDRKKAELALAERTLQLALAGKAALVGSFAYDCETERMQISEGYATIHAFPEGTTEIARSEWLASVHPVDRVRLEELRTRTLRNRAQEYSIDYRVLRPGGEVRWIDVRIFVSYFGDGRPRRIVGVDIDITERKRAEQALAERNLQLALAGRFALVGTFSFDIGAGRLQVSAGYAAIHGLPEGTEEATRADWRTRVHPDDLHCVEAGFERAIAARRSEYYCEYRIVLTSGEIRWIDSRSFISYDGKTPRLIGANIDVTQRKLTEAVLKEHETRLADALAAGQVMAFEWDTIANRSRRSRNAALILGDAQGGVESSRGSDFLRQVHPDDRETFKRHIRKLCRGNPSYSLNFRFCCPDGRQVWLEETGKAEFDPTGRLLRIKGLTRDITERRQAEEKLRESEREFRKLLGTLPAAIYVTDAAGRITYCNQAAVDLWGTTPKFGEDKWSDLSRFYQVDGKPMATQDCPTEVALKQGRTVSNLEAILERPDGTRIPIMPYPTPLHDGTGAIIGVVNMTVDISERKKAELSLADRTMQLALAGKVARVGSYSYDIGTDVMQVSEGYAVVHGLAEGTEKTTRSQWRARIHPEDLIRVEEVRKQAFRLLRAEYDIEYRIVRSGGEVRWIESRSFMLYNNDGAPQRVIGVNIDITERKRAEQILAERKTQLEVANNIAQVGSYTYNYATRMAWLGPGSASIYGLHENCVEMSSDEWRQYVHPDDLGQLIAEACQALANRQRELVCVFRILRHGEVRWIETRNRYFYDKAGRATQAIGATIDVTERRRAEDHKGRLVAELDHRVKNMLATVSVVASQTRDTSRSMEDFVTGLNGRIRSLASAHELLSIRRWQGMPMAELVQRELAPYATSNNTAIDGPEVMLSADVGQAMAMVVHELVTNAAKYGALSTQWGRVSVRWSQTLNGSAGQRFVFEWQETGGPRVEAPRESGYGISAIRELIPYEFGGTVDFALPPEGVRCRFEIPAAWLSGGNHQNDRLNGSSSTQPSPA